MQCNNRKAINEPAWFESWFNTTYYHTLYKKRDEQEAKLLLDNLTTAFQFVPSHNILDLACGRGRHSAYLSSLGLQVNGLDLSPASIAYAKAMATHPVQFAVHDMREPFGINTYDFVLNLFTSFGYFDEEDEDLQVMKNIGAALKKGGKVVIEYMNPFHTVSTLKKHEIKEVDGIQFEIMKEIRDGFIYKFIHFTDKDNRFDFFERVKLLYPNNFQQYFAESGLVLQAMYGDYRLNEFSESSERMILIATKQD